MKRGKCCRVTLPITFIHLQYDELHTTMLLVPVIVLYNETQRTYPLKERHAA